MQSEGQHKHRRCVLGSHSGREPSRRVTCPSQHVEMLLTFIFFLCSSANCRMPTTSKPSVAFPNCGRAGPTASFGGIWLMIPLRMTRSISAGYLCEKAKMGEMLYGLRKRVRAAVHNRGNRTSRSAGAAGAGAGPASPRRLGRTLRPCCASSLRTPPGRLRAGRSGRPPPGSTSSSCRHACRADRTPAPHQHPGITRERRGCSGKLGLRLCRESRSPVDTAATP